MCTQMPPHDYTQYLYDRYIVTIKDYLLVKVSSSLMEKCGEVLLEEFVRSWYNHKVLVNMLSEIFHYIDRYFVSLRQLHEALPAENVGFNVKNVAVKDLKHGFVASNSNIPEITLVPPFRICMWLALEAVKRDKAIHACGYWNLAGRRVSEED